MTAKFKAACVQVSAGDDMTANIETAVGFIREAGAAGADFVAMPENEHPALPAFCGAARDAAVWLLGGSLGIRANDGRVLNRTFLVDPRGDIAARYDKIHMFDVDLAGGETYRESDNFQPGSRVVTTPLPWGTLGMTICYDMRFPYLYRTLAHHGADIFTAPAAFTKVTGEAHWHLLLRARAVENGSFVIAPAQCGVHPGGRRTFGHSLIVDPWGKVLADGGEEPGVSIAEIDMARVAEVRGMVPSLNHDRPYSDPGADSDTSAA